MKLAICHCEQCRANRAWRKAMVRSKRSNKRSEAKAMLRQGKYNKLPERVIVGYTD